MQLGHEVGDLKQQASSCIIRHRKTQCCLKHGAQQAVYCLQPDLLCADQRLFIKVSVKLLLAVTLLIKLLLALN